MIYVNLEVDTDKYMEGTPEMGVRARERENVGEGTVYE